jgi:hypothetical protein
MPRRFLTLRIPLALALASVLLCLSLGEAQARDLRGRFALGFNNNFSSFSALSVKIGMPTPRPTLNIQAQALVGFSISAVVGEELDSGSDNGDQFFAGGRVLLPILAEDNLNVYGGIGAGYARQKDATGPLHLLRAQAVVGVEFFFFGLQNLGFSAEFGLKLDIAPGQVDVETSSGSAASVGIHYYF